MADKKVSELTAITNLSRDDLLLVVNDPSGTPASRKITHANFFGNVVSETVHKGATTISANTTISGTTLTVSANSTFSGNTTFSGGLTFSGATTFDSLFANVNVNVFTANAIFNGTITANSTLKLEGSSLFGGATGATRLFGSNGRLHANNTISSGVITNAMLATPPVTNTYLIATYPSNTSFQSYVANTNSRLNTIEGAYASNSYLTSTFTTNTTFQSTLANTNLAISDRMQVANTTLLVNDRMQVANVNALIGGEVVSKSSEVEQVMSANLVVDAGSNSAISGVHISNGAINIFSATGSPSLVDFYCEATNAHKVRVQAPTHSAILAGAATDIVLTLPNHSGNVATTNSETFTGTTLTENLTVNDLFRITTKVSDFATSNAVTESVAPGSIYYSNTYLYVVTDGNTIKRVLLSTW